MHVSFMKCVSAFHRIEQFIVLGLPVQRRLPGRTPVFVLRILCAERASSGNRVSRRL